jgi:hypothetical protein
LKIRPILSDDLLDPVAVAGPFDGLNISFRDSAKESLALSKMPIE